MTEHLLYRSKYIRAKEELYDYKCKSTLLFAFLVFILLVIYFRTHKPLEAKAEIVSTTAIRLVEIETPLPLRPKPKLLTGPIPIETPAKSKPGLFKSPYQSLNLEPKTNSESAKEVALAKTLSNEGGYNPRDSNGYPVKYGVNQGFYKPPKGYPRHVKDLTLQQARHYLASNYYDPKWDRAGYSDRYKAFLFDSAVQHGYTVRKINKCGKGDINKAVDCRIAHLRSWCYRTNCQHLKGMISRVNKYKV